MRRFSIFTSIFFCAILIVCMLSMVGCDKDEDEQAMTDGSSWSLMTTEEIKIPRAIWSFSPGNAIVCADSERVYTTTDGGLSWTTGYLPVVEGRRPNEVYWTSSYGVMVGERGLLYRSANNGATWVNAAPPSIAEKKNDLTAILHGPADNPLFITGDEGALLKSTDLGASWSDVFLNILVAESTMIVDTLGDTTWDTTDVYVNQRTISFYDGVVRSPSLIYVFGDSVTADDEYYLFRSLDGGSSWKSLKVALSGHFPASYFNSDTSGFVFGPDGAVYRFTIRDTIVSTSNVTLLGDGRQLSKVEFVSSDVGWVIGAGGTVAKSTNAGASWRLVNVDITGDITDIYFLDGSDAWLVGNDISRGTGAIKRTTDGGVNWYFRSYGLKLSLNAVHFVSPTEAWVVGKSGRIAHTTDGGSMWIHQDANSVKTFQDIFFLDSNKGWVVGFSTSTATDTFATILRTTNGGQLWVAVDSFPGQRLNSVAFANASKGWAVGKDGFILRSEDGGISWSAQVSGVSAELFDIEIMSENEAFAVGQYGTIIHTTNGGANWVAHNWQNPSNDTEQSLFGVDFVGNTGYACGSMGTVWKTTDRGASWSKLTMPMHSSTVFRSVAFVNSEVGWVVGAFGYIMHTVDGGATWYRQNEGELEFTLNDIFIFDAAHAWIVGDGNTFYKLNPGN